MYEYMATMIHVVDGDTMDFEVDLGFGIRCDIRVRLRGIDTPEIYHPRSPEEKLHGQQAAAFVQNRFLGKTGTLRTYKDKKGKYGRYLADFEITQDDITLSLCDELLENDFSKKASY